MLYSEDDGGLARVPRPDLSGLGQRRRSAYNMPCYCHGPCFMLPCSLLLVPAAALSCTVRRGCPVSSQPALGVLVALGVCAWGGGAGMPHLCLGVCSQLAFFKEET